MPSVLSELLPERDDLVGADMLVSRIHGRLGNGLGLASRVVRAVRPPPAARYILDGVSCTGVVVGEDGPCDRTYAMMWHEDGLVIEV